MAHLIVLSASCLSKWLDQTPLCNIMLLCRDHHTSSITSFLPSQHWRKPILIYTPGWRRVKCHTQGHNMNSQPLDYGTSAISIGPHMPLYIVINTNILYNRTYLDYTSYLDPIMPDCKYTGCSWPTIGSSSPCKINVGHLICRSSFMHTSPRLSL